MKIFIFLLCTNIMHIRSTSFTEQYYMELVKQEIKNAETHQFPSSNVEFEKDFSEFDFIIIGAGSAGSVLATRLSEIPSWKILLLEAGNEENKFNKIPGLCTQVQLSNFSWGYFSTPQENACQGMIDQKCSIPRGKAIGGSSAINALIYSRGSKYDYEKFVDLGNLGWSYKDVLPYFIKSENSQTNGDKMFHGQGGYLNVEYASELSPLRKILFEAFRELNIPIVDYNGNESLGASALYLNIMHGVRQSTGTAFLDKARKRSNLKVLTNALVTKIKFDANNRAANAIEFINNNNKFTAKASKEIILSAGAINSPQVLMLSGVGPKRELKKLNIKVVHDLPAVGKNLFEHACFLGLAIRTNYTRPNQTLEEIVKDYLNGEGLLTVPLHADSVYFTTINQSSKKVPEVEIIFAILSSLDSSVLGKSLNFNKDIIENFAKLLNPATDVLVPIVLLHAASRGKVSLKSKNPIDFPVVDFNLLADNKDLETLLGSIEYVSKILETKIFQKLNGRFVYPNICKDFPEKSKNYWKCLIPHLTFNFYHPSGTLSMGQSHKSSVVNTNLEVHGIKKLRVIDASVFPTTISGHLNAPTIMMAEKMADYVKTLYLFSKT